MRLVAFALVALVVLAPNASASTRFEAKSYYGGNDVLRFTEFDNVCQGGPHAHPAIDAVGGVCFYPQAGDANVTIQIQDATNLQVGGLLSFTTTGGFYTSLRFCDHVTTTIPAGTAVISVVVDGPLNGGKDCASPLDGPGFGTTGLVAATFT